MKIGRTFHREGSRIHEEEETKVEQQQERKSVGERFFERERERFSNFIYRFFIIT